MIGHTTDLAWSLDAVMIGKIENGILIELGDHGRIPVAPGGGDMLSKRIAIPAGRRKRNRCQQPDTVCRNGLLVRCDRPVWPARLPEREGTILPVVQVHAHRVGDVRVDQFHVI